MTLGQTLTPTLEQTLNAILSSLANFFGTTTDIILANAPEWLTKYGWYIILSNLPLILLRGALIAGLISGICFAIQLNIIADKKRIWTTTITIFIILIIIFVTISILPCIITPEIVGFEAAIKLISQ